ncbi:MAG: heat shock protein transcriptional repressor HspR [Actinomycetota bacterium]
MNRGGGEGREGRQGRERKDARDDRAVYVISVAAELAGVHPQTLRIYERKGLVTPRRTSGNSRRYSDRDIDLLRRIQELTQEHGVNLAGARMIIDLLSQVEELRGRVDELRVELTTVKRTRGEDAEGAPIPAPVVLRTSATVAVERARRQLPKSGVY